MSSIGRNQISFILCRLRPGLPCALSAAAAAADGSVISLIQPPPPPPPPCDQLITSSAWSAMAPCMTMARPNGRIIRRARTGGLCVARPMTTAGPPDEARSLRSDRRMRLEIASRQFWRQNGVVVPQICWYALLLSRSGMWSYSLAVLVSLHPAALPSCRQSSCCSTLYHPVIHPPAALSSCCSVLQLSSCPDFLSSCRPAFLLYRRRTRRGLDGYTSRDSFPSVSQRCRLFLLAVSATSQSSDQRSRPCLDCLAVRRVSQ